MTVVSSTSAQTQDWTKNKSLNKQGKEKLKRSKGTNIPSDTMSGLWPHKTSGNTKRHTKPPKTKTDSQRTKHNVFMKIYISFTYFLPEDGKSKTKFERKRKYYSKHWCRECSLSCLTDRRRTEALPAFRRTRLVGQV